jgi:hypothetical protein
MLAYLAIVSTATAAFLGAPVWTFLLGAAALMLLSAIEHRRIAMNAAWHSLEMLSWAAWQSAEHAMLASGAAYVLGYLTRLSF